MKYQTTNFRFAIQNELSWNFSVIKEKNVMEVEKMHFHDGHGF